MTIVRAAATCAPQSEIRLTLIGRFRKTFDAEAISARDAPVTARPSGNRCCRSQKQEWPGCDVAHTASRCIWYRAAVAPTRRKGGGSHCSTPSFGGPVAEHLRSIKQKRFDRQQRTPHLFVSLIHRLRRQQKGRPSRQRGGRRVHRRLMRIMDGLRFG